MDDVSNGHPASSPVAVAVLSRRPEMPPEKSTEEDTATELAWHTYCHAREAGDKQKELRAFRALIQLLR